MVSTVIVLYFCRDSVLNYHTHLIQLQNCPHLKANFQDINNIFADFEYFFLDERRPGDRIQLGLLYTAYCSWFLLYVKSCPRRT